MTSPLFTSVTFAVIWFRAPNLESPVKELAEKIVAGKTANRDKAEADGKPLNEDLHGFNLGYKITFREI